MLSCHQRHTFTMVELVTVIAIIAILASILLPALSEARWRSKQVVCASNMKQIGVAYISYEADTGQFPERGDPNDSHSQQVLPESSGRPILDYIGSAEVMYCPGRSMFLNYEYQADSFPITGYFHWGLMFPHGYRTRFPEAYSVTPHTWYNAYFPLASEVLRGGLVGFDRSKGNVTDSLNRVAHSRDGFFTGSNVLHHDGSVHWSKYRYGTRSDTGSYYGYNHPGTTRYISSYFVPMVEPEPFARQSGPPIY